MSFEFQVQSLRKIAVEIRSVRIRYGIARIGLTDSVPVHDDEKKGTMRRLYGYVSFESETWHE